MYYCGYARVAFHKIIMMYQVDIATNSHPDKADSNLTARTKGDTHTAANTALSLDEKTKKRRRDPNKHYISGMFCIHHQSSSIHFVILYRLQINVRNQVQFRKRFVFIAQHHHHP